METYADRCRASATRDNVRRHSTHEDAGYCVAVELVSDCGRRQQHAAEQNTNPKRAFAVKKCRLPLVFCRADGRIIDFTLAPTQYSRPGRMIRELQNGMRPATTLLSPRHVAFARHP